MKQKEILIITNYFPPESGAASNRIYSMAKGFAKINYKVTIVCPLPNYPQGKIFDGFKEKVYYKTETSFGFVNRLWILPTKSSNKIIRLISMLSFSFSLTLFLLFNKIPKKIIIQYSPIFVGFTGVFWSKLLQKKVILNVSDLWPLAGLEMGLLNKGIYYSILEKMEQFCYRNSDLILGQSEEILSHIKNLGITKPLFLYRNFPNFNPPKLPIENNDKQEIRIVYAGLLGVAQGLYNICLESKFTEKVSLHIYGTGPESEKIKVLNKPNVYYYGEIDRETLHSELHKFDLGFVPLINRIYGSVPSKIFELSRLGIPILYFAGGEGEIIIEKHNLGWVIPVNNYLELQDFIDSVSKEKLLKIPKAVVQKSSVENFNFEIQFQQLAEIIDEN